jgi:hypothetical protein
MFPAATRQTKIAEFSSHLLVYNSEHFSATKAETNISSPSGSNFEYLSLRSHYLFNVLHFF